MSRNDVFLLVAGAIVATVLAGGPSPLTRSPVMTIASLVSPPTDTVFTEPAVFRPTLGQQ